MRYPSFLLLFLAEKKLFCANPTPLHRHVLQAIDAQKLAAFSNIAHPYTNPTSTLH